MGSRDDLARAGIVGASPYGDIPWRDFFSGWPAPVQLCFAIGHTWSVAHARSVLRFACQGDEPVRVTIADDQATNGSLTYLQHMWGEPDQDGARARIQRTLDDWQHAVTELRREGLRPRVTIDRIGAVFPTTFYRVGDEMWLVPAPRAWGRLDVLPAVRCIRTGDRNQGLFDWTMEDFARAERDGLIGRPTEL